MGCEDLLLFLQHACYFFLEGEELLLVLASHCPLHRIDVFSDLFLVLVADDVLDLNLFLDLVGLFCRSYGLWWRSCFLDGVCSILLFVFFGLLLGKLFDFLDNFFWSLLWDLFWWVSWLWDLLFFCYNNVGTLWWHFVLRIFGLKDLLHILLPIINQSLWNRSIAFLFLDGLCTFNFLYIFSQAFLFDFNAILTLALGLCLIFPLDVVVDLVVLFAQLCLIL